MALHHGRARRSRRSRVRFGEGLLSLEWLYEVRGGTVVLDAAAQTGTLDVAIDVASVEFGNDKLNEEAVNSTAPPIFEAQKYPTAHYKGTLGGFVPHAH
jgi:hypothetical protein